MNILINKAIGFVTAHWKLFAFGLAFILISISFVVLQKCGGSPTIDEKEIQEDQRRIQEYETNRLNNTLRESENRLANIDNSLREAEANTKKATNKNYSNTKGSDLDKKAEKY